MKIEALAGEVKMLYGSLRGDHRGEHILRILPHSVSGALGSTYV